MNTHTGKPTATPSPLKAMVFIDGQNLFHRVKSLFGHREPDFDIRALSEGVCKRMKWEAAEVHFYSGMPTKEESPHWHRFWQGKLEGVRAQGGIPVHTFTPALRYHNAWTQHNDGEWRIYRSPQEKGVDVRLALDMVAAAYEQRCDAMVIMTEDTDLQQAVDRCLEIARKQGRQLHIANAIPQDFAHPSARRALAQTTPIRFDQAFYELHLDANQSAHFCRPSPVSPQSTPSPSAVPGSATTPAAGHGTSMPEDVMQRGQRAMQAAAENAHGRNGSAIRPRP